MPTSASSIPANIPANIPTNMAGSSAVTTASSVSKPAPRSLYGDALFVDETALDATHGAEHLAAELQAVKARVNRRRGMALLPVIVIAAIGTAAYLTLLEPVAGNSVEVVSDAPSDGASSGGDADELADAQAAAEADQAIADFAAAAPADAALAASSPDTGSDAGPLGDSDADGSAAGAAGDESGSDAATQDSPNDHSDSSTDVAASGLDQPNPPAVPIEFDTSNVITRQSPASAPLPTPPVAAADTSGLPAGATARVPSSLANNSDAEVGAASLSDLPLTTGDDNDASTSVASGDALEGPLDASPESLTNTDNPSIGGEGSGEGANSAPNISFEDDGSTPQISATSSRETGETGETGDPVVSEPARVLATPHFAAANQQVTLTFTATEPDGEPVGPCGVTIDWGDGQVDSLPCAPECTMQPQVLGEVEVQVVHDFAAAGVATITVSPDTSGCLSAPVQVLQLTLLAG